MPPHKNIRLKKMVSIGTPAVLDESPLVYLTAQQAAAMAALKDALVRPANDPRRMGDMQDALYILTHGENALGEDIVQKEVDRFLAAREKEAQDRTKNLAETFADIPGRKASPAAPRPVKPRRGPAPGY